MHALTERLDFPGAHGATLSARLDRPFGPVRAVALFANCFTCSKDLFAVQRIAAGLTGHGIAVLRFDFTGLGASGGEFASTNFSSNVADLVAAADFLRNRGEAPSLLKVLEELAPDGEAAGGEGHLGLAIDLDPVEIGGEGLDDMLGIGRRADRGDRAGLRDLARRREHRRAAAPPRLWPKVVCAVERHEALRMCRGPVERGGVLDADCGVQRRMQDHQRPPELRDALGAPSTPIQRVTAPNRPDSTNSTSSVA